MVLSFFKHYLFSRHSGALVRTIAWVCIGGVGVGVMAMVVVLSVMNGFDGAIRDRLLAVEPHVVVKFNQIDDVARRNFEQKIFDHLSNQSGIRSYGYESQDVIVRTVEGLYGGGLARGVETDVLRDIFESSKNEQAKLRDANSEKLDPPTIEEETLNLEVGEVAMGVDLAHSLGIFEGDEAVLVAPESLLLPPGEVPPYEKVKVRSLLRTSVPDVDSQMVYYLRERGLKRLLQYAQLEKGIEIRLRDPDLAERVKAEIQAIVGEKGKIETWKERNSALFYSLKMEKLAMGLFLGLSVLIGSFSILSVLVLLVTQKRVDIGVLMAMGLSARRTRSLFTGVGLVLSSIGLVGGVLVGLFICWVLIEFPVIRLPDIYYDTRIPVIVEPAIIGGIILASVIIAGISSWLPAWMSTKMAPADAIRPSTGKAQGQ